MAITTSAASLQEKVEWIRLSRSEHVGRSTFFRLIKIFGSPRQALEQVSHYAFEGGSRNQIKIYSASDAAKEVAESHKFGAEIVLFNDEYYPKLLREISDPPPILMAKGCLDFLNRPSIAIVGPRNASFNGVLFAKKIARELGENDLIIVSGMARGIDAAAHEVAIAKGTVAVIAGGINHIYPKENTELYHKICRHGLVISESPFNAPPKGGNFVQRNRIISGLSLGVVVIEASLRSGSLVTARFGAEQGREVFAVPGSPFDPRCLGTNRLIKQGAKLTENVEDILEEISAMKNRFGGDDMLKEPDSEDFINFVEKMPSDEEVKKIRQEILQRLNNVPLSIESIIQEMQAPARLVNIAVVQLELADKVEVNYGKVFKK